MFKQWNDTQTFSNRLVLANPTADSVVTVPNKTFTVGELDTVYAMPANNIDLSMGKIFTKTITGTTTFTISNAKPLPDANTFALRLTNGGSAVVTWFSGLKFPNGTPITMVASGVDTITVYSPDGGTTWEVIGNSKDVR